MRTLFTASNGAKCGMASFNPVPHKREIVFTLGPENPTGAWTYAPHRRRGALADCSTALKFRQNPGDRHGGATRANEPPNLSPSSNDTGEGGAAKRTNAPTRTRAGYSEFWTRGICFPTRTARSRRARCAAAPPRTRFPDGLLVSAAYEDAVLLRNANLSSTPTRVLPSGAPSGRSRSSRWTAKAASRWTRRAPAGPLRRGLRGSGHAARRRRRRGARRRRRRRGRGRAPRRARRGRVLGRAAGVPAERRLGGGGKAARWPSSGRWTRTRTAATTKDVRSLRPNREPGDVGRVGPGPARKSRPRGNTSSFRARSASGPRGAARGRRRRRRSRVPPATRPRPPSASRRRRDAHGRARAARPHRGAPSAESSAAAAAASVPDPGVATKGKQRGQDGSRRRAGRGRGRGRGPPVLATHVPGGAGGRASARWTTTASRSCTWCAWATTARRRRSCR